MLVDHGKCRGAIVREMSKLGFDYTGVGEVKALMGNTEEGKPMLQRAYNLLLRCLGASHPHTVRAFKALQSGS